MSLQTYRGKRKFDVTPEPRGGPARPGGNAFVVQKHAARRLHYDLRLELDGVMKSWAVTRGPSLDPAEKRLAVQVEDHPVEYNAFEGSIPEGEYGGGTVLVWDRGRWLPQGDPHRGLAKGHLEFELEGEKLHGRWHLVRMRRRAGETKDPWLLIKVDDAAARTGAESDILSTAPLSVVSGRSIEEIAAGKGARRVWRSSQPVAANVEAGAIDGPSARSAASAPRKPVARRRRALGDDSLPDFVPPALAAGRGKAPSGKEWVHEVKFDGYRIQARLDHGSVRLLTRKGLSWAERFPNVAAAVAVLPAETALLDGEIVIEDARGISTFSGLQAALEAGERERFIYYVFDLLHLDGRDLTGLPLLERKEVLAQLIGRGQQGTIRFSEHFTDDGPTVLRHAGQMSLEGIVSKRRDARYASGRSDAFVKVKCVAVQEVVIIGYAPSTVASGAVGSLIAGYYDDGRLVYAGRVGTGYTQDLARRLWRRLQPLARRRTALAAVPAVETRSRDAHWVEPELVAEVEFRGWTADGLLRQAAFRGLREDKPASEVVREPFAPAGRDDDPAATVRRSSMPSARDEIRLTHPHRVYWSDVGVTKQELVDYYRAVWERMAPHLVNRPLSLLRCPEGIDGEHFFQKHAAAGLSTEHLRTVRDAGGRQIIAIDDLGGLLSLAQAGVLEVHVRGSRLDRLDLCDRIVLDIDPGEDVAWADVVAAARDVRARLAGIGLESFVKLTGGKGLHVMLPVEAVDWERAKTFAQAVALAMVADEPRRYVAKMTKSVRRGKIFVDYLRNAQEQTAVAIYSTRARPGAPVSTPVTWDELGRTKAGGQHGVRNIARRLARLDGDPWQEMAQVRQRLPDPRQL
ncbi:MAG: DNA ligase D [Hyphomicrobiales bacterium]|nr:DNA ligase D [Hyphomicrobiales bacterium]